MEGSVFLQILADLKSEGLSGKAADLESKMREAASNLEFECLAKAPIGKPFALLRRTHDSSENDRLSTGLAPLALPSFWRR